MTALIAAPENAPPSIWVTFCVAAREGKKTEQGTMMSLPKHKSNPVAVADPPEAQILTLTLTLTLTPATTGRALNILTNSKMCH
jgi:hypothetical protein